MNTNSNIEINKDRKFDLFYLFEIIKEFKIIVLSSIILFCILSSLFYSYYAKTTKSFEIEIYKYELSQIYNFINTDEIFQAFALSLRDYKVYRDVFEPIDLAKSVFASSSYISTQQKFKLIIPDKYINDNNRNDFNKFMSHAYKQTIDKTVLGLEKTQRKLLIEQDIIFQETNLFNLDKNYAKLRLGDGEIIAVVEKDFIREILDLSVSIKLIEEDIENLKSLNNLDDFMLINLDSSIETTSSPNLILYVFIGGILGFIIGAIIAILRNDYKEYYKEL